MKTASYIEPAGNNCIPANNSCIMVTGGAGFIGSHLCERLITQGHTVICLDNFNDNYSPSIKRSNIQRCLRHCEFKLVEGNILDSDLIDQLLTQYHIDTIIHLAALAGVRNSILAPLNYIDIDVKGTVGLLEAARKHDIKKFVFASSSSVYGSNATPFSEKDPLGTQSSPYAAAKHSAELFCRTYNQLYGFPVVCLRFFTVYGPRQRPDMAINIFTSAIDEEREISIYGDGSSFRDYTYIDDVIDGITASIDLQCGYEVINLGSSVPISLLSLVRTIEEKMEKHSRLHFIPDQPGDVPATLADITRAADLLGYAPKVTLTEGVRLYTDWYLQRISFQETSI